MFGYSSSTSLYNNGVNNRSSYSKLQSSEYFDIASYEKLFRIRKPQSLDKTTFVQKVLTSTVPYSLSLKADGDSVLLYVNNYGKLLYVSDNDFLSDHNLKMFEKLKSESFFILQAERIVNDSYYFYDFLPILDKSNRKLNFVQRYECLQNFVSQHGENLAAEQIFLKHFYISENMDVFKKNLRSILLDDLVSCSEFPNDGIIFMSSNVLYHSSIVYKWKPVDRLTIDFLVLHNEYDEEYKLCSLMGVSQERSRKYKEVFIKGRPAPENYKYVLYSTIDCSSGDDDEVIAQLNKDEEYYAIFECIYDVNLSKFRLVKLRKDKTVEFNQSGRGPNNIKVVEETMKLIRNPFDVEDILSQIST